jgi:hypothetical protein
MVEELNSDNTVKNKVNTKYAKYDINDKNRNNLN